MAFTLALGKKGKNFVLRKLMEIGWKFPVDYDDTLPGIDWVLEKDHKVIKIQVKTSNNFRGISFGYICKTLSFLLITDLVDIWVFPTELINASVRIGTSEKYSWLKNNFKLLELDKFGLYKEINDFKIRFSEMMMRNSG